MSIWRSLVHHEFTRATCSRCSVWVILGTKLGGRRGLKMFGFFVVGLRLPTHRFIVKVMRKFEIQIHQLTLNAMVALAKYVWPMSSFGGELSTEVFAKNYCLHWQRRKLGGLIAQFGSCTFTPRTGKTSTKVIEIVLCAKNKWDNQ